MLRHWGLARDPFSETDPPFVDVPSQGVVLARLASAIETDQRVILLRGDGGLGKTLLLARALNQARQPTRVITRTLSPADGLSLLVDLANGLGKRLRTEPSRAVAWRALADAVRLCRLQGLRVVMAIDGDDALSESSDRLDLERLSQIDPHPGARLSIVRVGQTEPADPWALTIRPVPLTRGEAQSYLHQKLAASGRLEAAFTPRAITRLHAWARGIPRGLDRLAALGLRSGAARGLSVVGPDLIDQIAEREERDWWNHRAVC